MRSEDPTEASMKDYSHLWCDTMLCTPKLWTTSLHLSPWRCRWQIHPQMLVPIYKTTWHYIPDHSLDTFLALA